MERKDWMEGMDTLLLVSGSTSHIMNCAAFVYGITRENIETERYNRSILYV